MEGQQREGERGAHQPLCFPHCPLRGGEEQLLRFMAIGLHEGVESNGLEPPIH